MKRTLLYIAFLTVVLGAYAVQADRFPRLFILPDGKTIEATLVGDESFSYYLTTEGKVIEYNDTLGYVLTGQTALEYTLGKGPRGYRRVGLASSAPLKQKGHQYIPVVLVNFADKKFTVASTDSLLREYYQLYCNGTMDGERYTGAGSYGSIRDYFMDQSSGQFQPEFVPIGPVQLDSVAAWYGKDNGNSKDVNFSAFSREVITKAAKLLSDWSQFDNDGNGTVDMVFIIYAGMGQNTSYATDDIWPKESPSGTTVNNTRFGVSATTSELRRAVRNGEYVAIPDGVGVFCHELSHALGLPDFYDYNNVAFGMDYWSIMDYGNYADNGYTPGGYTAYERDFMGWQPLNTLEGPCTLRLLPFAEGGEGYRVVNQQNPNEYYVLENRQASGWDCKLCTRGHGMQVTHVDYNQSAWTGNRLNSDANHQRMTIISANNTYIGSNNYKGVRANWNACMAGSLFPGTSENHELTDESTPASVVFTGNYMSQPLYDIEESEDGVITLKYNPLGTLETPEDLMPSDIDWEKATITWESVPEAEWYNIRLLDEDGTLVTSMDSITTTSCVFAGLAPETSYTVEVQALADAYRNSEWAQTEVFKTLEDGISDITESGALVRVYNTEGKYITQCYADEIKRLSLRHGIYILRYSDGTTKKIMIN